MLRIGICHSGFLPIVCLLMVTGCKSATQSANRAPGWALHRLPGGLQLETPADWQVQTNGAGVVQAQGPENVAAAVWPVFSSQPLRRAAAAATAQALAGRVWPQAQWRIVDGADHIVRLAGFGPSRVGIALFSWVETAKGTAACLELARAPRTRYAAALETFSRILASVKFSGASHPSAAPAGFQYAAWHDPRENAFSAELPRDWRIQGGMFRYAPTDVRLSLRAYSPHGQLMLAVGDAQLPPFTLPSPLLAMGGIYPGGWYSPGYGVHMRVEPYASGTMFVRNYVLQTMPQMCAGLKLAAVRDRADAASSVNSVYRQFTSAGIAVELTAGEIGFSCQRQGNVYVGDYFAATRLVQLSGGSSIWDVPYLYGYLAPASREGEALAAMRHLLATFRLNPKWEAMQQNVTMQSSAIVARTGQAISGLLIAAYEHRQRVLDETGRREENAILGTVDVIDPETGEPRKIDDSSNYYWVNGLGHIVGTNTDAVPDIRFHRMLQLP